MSDLFPSLRRELRALLEEDDLLGTELLLLFRWANRQRKGREGRFHKGPFALYWLFRRLEPKYDTRTSLLIRRKKPRKTVELERFLDWLAAEDEDLYCDLFGDTPELNRVLSRAKDRDEIERAIINPDIPWDWEQSTFIDSVEAKTSSLQATSLQEAEYIFHDLLEMGPRLRRKMEMRWREIRKDDRLTGRIFTFIRGRMKQRDDWIKTLDLQRRFTKTKNQLEPILQRLEYSRLISWDRKTRRILINSYDPQDVREFVWLASSSWSTSPFEPRLDTGQVYRVKDFRIVAVEKWVKDRSAKFRAPSNPM